MSCCWPPTGYDQGGGGSGGLGRGGDRRGRGEELSDTPRTAKGAPKERGGVGGSGKLRFAWVAEPVSIGGCFARRKWRYQSANRVRDDRAATRNQHQHPHQQQRSSSYSSSSSNAAEVPRQCPTGQRGRESWRGGTRATTSPGTRHQQKEQERRRRRGGTRATSPSATHQCHSPAGEETQEGRHAGNARGSHTSVTHQQKGYGGRTANDAEQTSVHGPCTLVEQAA